MTRGLLVLSAVALAAVSSAQVGSIFVDSQSNIFGYGESTPNPGGGSGGVIAPTILLDAGTGRTMTFSATGSATWGGGQPNGPDGGNFASSTNINGVGPISGFQGPLSGHLLGVFVEPGDVSGEVAPGNFSYGSLADYQMTDYSPALRQVFFVGDGLTATGSGATQTFNIPDGAGRLVLGIADGFGFSGNPGFYGDNVGGFNVEYTAVPEPASMIALGAGVVALMRRRRKA